MKLKKALVALVCAVALVTATFLGTMAYFTDNDFVTNTFTVGRVGISLDEAPVDANGKATSGARVKSNTYHLIPGQTYDKDPTIHVDSDSEDCYLFVKIENNISAFEGGTTVAEQMETLKWVPVEGVNNVYTLAKGNDKPYAVSKGADVVVFNNFTIDGMANTVTGWNAIVQDKDNNTNVTTIEVTAYAIQKAGFENMTAQEIWETAAFN